MLFILYISRVGFRETHLKRLSDRSTFWPPFTRILQLWTSQLHTKRLKHKGCVEIIEKYGYLTIRIPENWCSCSFPIRGWNTIIRNSTCLLQRRPLGKMLNLMFVRQRHIYRVSGKYPHIFLEMNWTPFPLWLHMVAVEECHRRHPISRRPLVLLPGVLPKISRFVPKKLSLHWSVIASATRLHRIFRGILQYPFFFITST